MLAPKQIRSKLEKVIRKAAKKRAALFKNPGSDFIRESKCSLMRTVKLILHLGGSTLPSELQSFFGTDTDYLPTVSAFVQQRGKLNDNFFPYVFQAFNQEIPFTATKDGMHWLGVDGTDTNLPTNRKDEENYVRYKNSEGGYWQMHLNALFDLEEHRFLDLVIQPRPLFNEPLALCEMVDRCTLGENTVFVADRGYPCWNLLAHVQENKMFFLFRSKGPASPGSQLKNLKLPDSGEFDVSVSLGITRSSKKEFKKHPDKFRVINVRQKFDFIPYGDKESVYYLDFRVVSVQLSTGEYEYLITNLPRDRFDIQKLKEYYNNRWGIETAFRHLKYAVSMVRFHSANRSFIKQEIYASVILQNYTSLINSWANRNKEKKARKKTYRVSFSNTVTVTKETLKTDLTDENILILLVRYQVAEIPGRKEPRKVRSQSAVPLGYRAG